MEKKYWLARKRSAAAMARKASSAEARLIHYDLAGRYSIKAAQCAPFMIPVKKPATEGEGAALDLPRPGTGPKRGPRPIGDPDSGEGTRR